MRRHPVRLAALFLLAAAAASAQEAGHQAGLSIEPAEIVAGMFYDGALVHVRAPVPAGARVAIVARGEAGPLQLRRKGKALGVVWMNVGEVAWETVPALYVLSSSVAVDALAPTAELERLGIGLASLRVQARPAAGADSLFGELTRLKQKDGLWATAAGAVEITPGADGAIAAADLPIPVKAPAGRYEVLVYAFEDGVGALAGSGTFEVRQGGIPAFIASLAGEHGLLYGVLAVLVAVAVGLLTGVVFGLGSKKGH
jgi:uncharacterized protein (TIGR02186 family)